VPGFLPTAAAAAAGLGVAVAALFLVEGVVVAVVVVVAFFTPVTVVLVEALETGVDAGGLAATIVSSMTGLSLPAALAAGLRGGAAGFRMKEAVPLSAIFWSRSEVSARGTSGGIVKSCPRLEVISNLSEDTSKEQ
jgi:hypothetical protein